jgi:hypothetical protein
MCRLGVARGQCDKVSMTTFSRRISDRDQTNHRSLYLEVFTQLHSLSTSNSRIISPTNLVNTTPRSKSSRWNGRWCRSARSRYQHFAVLHGRLSWLASWTDHCIGCVIELCGSCSTLTYCWKIPGVKKKQSS